MTKDKAYVGEIYTRSENKSIPVLLNFQNGKLNNAHKDSTLYFPAKYESDKKRKHAVVVTSGNVYSGPVADASQELVDTYVCIRNKRTDSIRILPIDQVKLINHVYKDKNQTEFAMLSKDTAKETLMRTFGGRRDMRTLNNQERNKVNIEVFRDALETTVEKSEIIETEEQEVSTEIIIDRIRPKLNKDAKNLPSVYDVHDIIPLELLDRLDEEVGVLMGTDIEDIPISSEFLKQAILKLKVGGIKSNQSVLKMKIILYMDGLQTLIKTKERSLKKIELSQITEKVENDIRKRFSRENDLQPYRSSTTNEKALCYYLVLAFLISDDFLLDLNVLSEELSMSKANIIKYGNVINATLKAKTNFLALKLPGLVKLNLSLGRKRRHK